MAPKIPTRIPPDYLVLPITLPALPSLSTPSTHYLYIRRHTPTNTDSTTPSDTRTLFLSNLPVDTTEPHLRSLFTALGCGLLEKLLLNTTTAVSSSNKRKHPSDDDTTAATPSAAIAADARKFHIPGTPALALFLDRASCDATLAALQSHLKSAAAPPVWGAGLTAAHAVQPLGSARYQHAHAARFPDTVELAEGIDAYMAAFAAEEEEHKRAAARRRTEVDEDGFISVVRGGRGGKGSASREAAEKMLVEMKEREEKRRLKGFYRWQVREEGKERQKRLLEGFERDREVVERRKKGRSFVPL